MFAACDLSTDVDIILCASVINQLDELEAYNVPKCSVEAPEPVSVSIVTTRAAADECLDLFDITTVVSELSDGGNDDDNISLSTNSTPCTSSSSSADLSACETLKAEQQVNESLKRAWSFAEQNKCNFYVKDDFLYHRLHFLPPMPILELLTFTR